MAIVNATEQNFNQTVNSGLVLVDFWAAWCGPCRMLSPILEELDDQIHGTVKIVKVNVDEQPGLAAKYGIMSIPTLKLFKNGTEVTTVVGVQPLASLKELVQRYA